MKQQTQPWDFISLTLICFMLSALESMNINMTYAALPGLPVIS